MAVVAATLKESPLYRASGRRTQQWYGTSAEATEITISSAGKGARRLVSVSVKYGGSASTTITVTHNYATIGGTTYDVLLDSTTLSSDTDYVFYPPADHYMGESDTITVVAPLLAGQTARVVITLEVL